MTSEASLAGQHIALLRSERVAAVRATGLIGTPSEPAFDRIAAMARRLLGARWGFVTLVDDRRVFFKSLVPGTSGHEAPTELPLSGWFCPNPVASGQVLMLGDTSAEVAGTFPPGRRPLTWAGMPVVAYAAAPLVDDHGWALGTVGVAHDQPRAWTDDDRATLCDLAHAVVGQIQLRAQRQQLERAEAWLSSRAQELQLAMQAAQVATFEWDLSSGHVAWSENLELWQRLPPGAFGGSFDAFLAQVHEADRARVHDTVLRALQSDDGLYRCEFRMLRADGSVRWTDTRGRVERDAQGVPRRMVGVDVDISERKATEAALAIRTAEQLAAEAALHDSHARLSLVMQAAQVGCWETELPSGRTRWDDRVARLLGMPSGRSDAGPHDWMQSVHPDDRARVAAAVDRAVGTGAPYDCEFRAVGADSRVRWLQGCGVPVRDAQGRVVRLVGVAHDVTARKTAEGQLADEHAVLEKLLATAPIGFALFDRDLRFLMVNERLAEINGLPRADHIGRTVGELLPGLEAQARRMVDRVIATGQPVLGHEVCGETARAPGVVHHWLESWYPIRTNDGALLGIAAVVEEITERKRAEQALLDADRRKDDFLAMVAHELRNPLAPIRAGVQLLLRRASSDADVRQLAAVLDRQSAQLARVVDDLLDIARVNAGKLVLERALHDAREVLEAGVEAARAPALAKRQHLLVALPPAGQVMVDGDFARLVQIVGNLAVNASKFTPDGGTIQVRGHAPADGHFEIEVQDDGPGLEQESLAAVFDLYHQGVGADGALAGGGLGIGLTIVRKLVEAHGGSVGVRSEGPGRGACFTVRLPAQPGASAVPAPAPAPASSTRRVLVVDDNVDAADMVAMLLRLDGHSVQTCYDGSEGCARAQSSGFDVVLMDLHMPGCSGLAAARVIRSAGASRSATLIAVTGHGQPEDRAQAARAGFDALLIKPVDVDALRARLHAPPERLEERLAEVVDHPDLQRCLTVWRDVRRVHGQALLAPLLSQTSDFRAWRVVLAVTSHDPCAVRLLEVGEDLKGPATDPLMGQTLSVDQPTLGSMEAAYAQVVASAQPSFELLDLSFGAGRPLMFRRLVLPACASPSADPTHLVAFVRFDPGVDP